MPVRAGNIAGPSYVVPFNEVGRVTGKDNGVVLLLCTDEPMGRQGRVVSRLVWLQGQ